MNDDVLNALVALVAEAANTGDRWSKRLPGNDWRAGLTDELRQGHISLLPSQDIGAMRQKLKGKIKKGSPTELGYFILKPLSAADREKWVPMFGFEMRENHDGEMQYCYHVLFFGKSNDALKSFGHRFDGPEGRSTTHNYYHLQPLKSLRSGVTIPGAIQVQPDTFPTLPLHAVDPLDLALHAINTASGPEFINQLCRDRLDTELTIRANTLTKSLSQ